MFKKILVANRGEIALRVQRACRELGVKAVMVYSEADKDMMAVRIADEAICVGPAIAKESYLDIRKMVAAAQAAGADAVHPGYGFLSESAEFARAVEAAGMIFVGPSGATIERMGDKVAARQAAEAAGVPVVPGSKGRIDSVDQAAEVAEKVGYPVMIKASAGGGGKGMRAVDKAEDFAAALESCKREAINSFGDDAVLVEKYVQRPRHIEIQVFGDTHGNCVYLFERDCSVQRRHQKVLEEAPAPGMTPELRARMGEAAVAAARAVNYVGAGTVEFIVEQPGGYGLEGADEGFAAGPPQGVDLGFCQTRPPRGAGSDTQCATVGARFYFMEMNTRLQVEHPVTEAITGLDLVEWQLRVASGEPLPLKQEDLRIHGHAIEARICAENPDNNFLPATGALNVYALPECVTFERGAVRVDSGVRQGDAISPFYDSMVAKLIVHGDTREQALARLDEALAQTHIVGLATNVQFLRRVARTDSFAQAKLDTALIQREQAVLFHQEPVGLPLAAAAAVAQTLLHERASEGADPFSRRDGFHTHGVVQRRFEFEFAGEHVKASLTYERGGSLTLSVGSGEAMVTSPLVFEQRAGGIELQFAGQRTRAAVYPQGEVDHVFTPLGATQITSIDLLAHSGETAAEGGRLTAPMPGKVVSFAVKAGDAVTKGQPLAVMEAMKMEHTIAAPTDGVVQELLYAPGDQVTEGAELLKLSAA